MKADLARYGIQYDQWFFESSLHDSGYVADTVQAPVSYTHLDVYKRQALASRERALVRLGRIAAVGGDSQRSYRGEEDGWTATEERLDY